MNADTLVDDLALAKSERDRLRAARARYLAGRSPRTAAEAAAMMAKRLPSSLPPLGNADAGMELHITRDGSANGPVSGVTMVFRSESAVGEVQIVPGVYGAYILVNGAELALVDLYHLVPEQVPDGEPFYPQIIVYNDEGVPVVTARWPEGQVEVEWNDPRDPYRSSV